jgi:hypothetical protein
MDEYKFTIMDRIRIALVLFVYGGMGLFAIAAVCTAVGEDNQAARQKCYAKAASQSNDLSFAEAVRYSELLCKGVAP